MAAAKFLFAEFLNFVDRLVAEATADAAAQGALITCGPNCGTCCYLLVEISWEEAAELAGWIRALPPAVRDRFMDRVHQAAAASRQYFQDQEGLQALLEPQTSETPTSNRGHHLYFLQARLPCPFLDNDCCAAYAARPTACRMHVVSSPSGLCAHDVPAARGQLSVPEQITRLQDEMILILDHVETDGRWGALPIMVQAALQCGAGDVQG